MVEKWHFSIANEQIAVSWGGGEGGGLSEAPILIDANLSTWLVGWVLLLSAAKIATVVVGWT